MYEKKLDSHTFVIGYIDNTSLHGKVIHSVGLLLDLYMYSVHRGLYLNVQTKHNSKYTYEVRSLKCYHFIFPFSSTSLQFLS